MRNQPRDMGDNITGAIIMLGMFKWTFWFIFMVFWIWPILSWVKEVIALVIS